MKKNQLIFLMFLLSGMLGFAQNPSCSDGYVYMDAGAFISYYDPSLPLSPTNPVQTNIPTFGGGLALMPNISGGTLSPTFYTTFGNDYYYWSGTAWVNTGHSTGNSSAVNMAGCGSAIYNLVGFSGQVYVYNGSGNGTLLTTLPNFNGGGPYDLVTDCNCNFYVLNTTTPNQGLSMYNPSGALQCTYTLSGMPNTSAGGGFAIIGNTIYVKNNTTNGFYIGTITGGAVSFTAVSGFTATPGDFASCPVCYAPTSLLGASITASNGGTLSCSVPSLNLVITTTATGVSYNWSGPGIVAPNTGSQVTVNAAGVYSCLVSTSGCPPSQNTFTMAVVSNSLSVLASITPSGNVCANLNSPTHLVVAHSSTNATIVWNGPAMSPVSGTNAINASNFGSYSVTVTDVATGCFDTKTVTILQTPTVSFALSDNTVCLQGYNSSPVSITLTPSGASNYTLLTSTNYSTSVPNGPVMPCFPTTLAGNLSPYATGTLIGSSSGGCTDTIPVTFTIIPNPNITLSQTSAGICPGGSTVLSVIGATQYVWGGGAGLNQYTGNSVIASPTVSTTYTVLGSDNGCKSLTQTVSVVILPLPLVSINTNTSLICLGSVLSLNASGTATSFTWLPSTGILSGSANPVVSVSPSNTVVYTVIGSLNTCTSSASSTVYVAQPPVLYLNLSSPTLCAFNYNNSPNNINLTPSGAANYTLLADNGIFVNSPNGPLMQAVTSGTAFSGQTAVTVTLTGQTSVCTTSITKTFTVIPNPSLTISPPSASTCPGQSQAFSVSGATNYTWLPMPNYTLTSSSSIVANPSLTSFYSVIGTKQGCRSATKNAVLLVLPIPEVSVSPNSSTVCAGNSVTLTAVGNGDSYSWSPAGTLSSGSGLQVTATPAALQTYTVKATLNTCTSQAVSTVSVIVMPVIYASTSQPTICSSASTHLNVTGADSFLWFPNENLNSPSGNVVIASPNESTTYTVHGYNGICTGSTTIYVQTIRRPDMQLIADENEVCTGRSLPISVKGAESYTWLPVTGLTPVGSNTTVIAAPLVNTNYTVTGANSMGNVSCYQQLSYSVMVVPAISPVVSKDAYICEGERVTLYASGGNTYSWMPSYGLNITNESGVVANPDVTMIYTVEVSHNSFCGLTTTVMVAVSPNPEVYAGRDTSYNLNEAIFIQAKGTGTLTWVQGEDVVCADCPQTQVYPSHNGCYIVQAINEEGCKATDDICIELTEDFTVYIPNTFTPNNDGINDRFLIFGENISDISMEIYDRWGLKLFYSEDFLVGWDGKYKDVLCPVGVYTYIIRYTGLNRKKYTRTGNINIVK